MSPSPPDNNQGLLPAHRLEQMLQDTSSSIYRVFRDLYPDTSDLNAIAQLCLEAVRTFCEQFGPDQPVFLVRSTGRVNLMGMHVDHRGGFVNPIAIKEVFFVVQPRQDDIVEIRSARPWLYPPRSFSISHQLGQEKIHDWDIWSQQEFDKRKAQGDIGDWSNYVKAAVLYLQHIHTSPDGTFDPPLRGMNIAVRGDIPVASGLSSSSAIVVGSMLASLKVNGFDMPPLDMVENCRLAEWFVGTRGGGGDHAAIRCGKKNRILHVGSFPFSVSDDLFPDGYSLVLADSLVESRKQAGARDLFNQRIGSYIFSLCMLRKSFPEYADKMQHLRDVNPQNMGVPTARIYQMLRSLPQRATRSQISAQLPSESDLLDRTFSSHAEPDDGYRIREVCLYGIAECIRSEMAGQLLRDGDIRGFGQLINISHDGDRVSRLLNGKRVPQDNGISDAQLDQLAELAESTNPQDAEHAQLWRQPGGYDVSTPELDALVDIASTVPGLVGAGLVGAGLGGSIIALVQQDHANDVIQALDQQYYQPQQKPLSAEIVKPVAGAGILPI